MFTLVGWTFYKIFKTDPPWIIQFNEGLWLFQKKSTVFAYCDYYYDSYQLFFGGCQ